MKKSIRKNKSTATLTSDMSTTVKHDNGQITIGSYLIVRYQKKYFPGIVINIEDLATICSNGLFQKTKFGTIKIRSWKQFYHRFWKNLDAMNVKKLANITNLYAILIIHCICSLQYMAVYWFLCHSFIFSEIYFICLFTWSCEFIYWDWAFI